MVSVAERLLLDGAVMSTVTPKELGTVVMIFVKYVQVSVCLQ